jgi:hypothetical protein
MSKTTIARRCMPSLHRTRHDRLSRQSTAMPACRDGTRMFADKSMARCDSWSLECTVACDVRSTQPLWLDRLPRRQTGDDFTTIFGGVRKQPRALGSPLCRLAITSTSCSTSRHSVAKDTAISRLSTTLIASPTTRWTPARPLGRRMPARQRRPLHPFSHRYNLRRPSARSTYRRTPSQSPGEHNPAHPRRRRQAHCRRTSS